MIADVRTGWRDLPGRAAWIAFAVLLVLSPFEATVRFDVVRSVPLLPGVLPRVVTVSEIALAATLGLWVLSLILRPRRPRLGPAFLTLPVAGLLAIAWLGVPFSIDPKLAARSAFGLSLAVALAIFVMNETRRIDRLATPVALMIAIQAVVAIGQVAGQHSLGLAMLGERVLDPAVPGTSIVGSIDGTRLLRAYGLTAHPNILGGILAFALLIIGGLPGGSTLGRAWRAAIIGLGAVALFLTFSRAAWIALAVGLVVALAMAGWMRDRIAVRGWLAATVVTLAVGAVLVVPFIPFVAARTGTAGPIATETRSIDERVALAKAGIALVADRPLVGYGMGTVIRAMRGEDRNPADDYEPAHIVVLDVAIETGLLGALCYLVIVVAPWVALIRIPHGWTPALVTASAVLVAVTVVGLFDHYPWTQPAGRLWAWMALGWWAVAYHDAIQGGRGA
jgi:O-antigen ligase